MKIKHQDYNKLIDLIQDKLDKAKQPANESNRTNILNPVNISLQFNMTVENLIKVIDNSNKKKLKELWNVLIDAWDRSMFGNEDYKGIQKELAQYKLKIYDTKSGTLPNIEIIFPTPSEIKANVENINKRNEVYNANAYKILLDLEKSTKND